MTDNNGLVLVFDTETTGIPLFHQPSDDPAQPEICELSAELCRPDGTVVETLDTILRISQPMPADVLAIHGITDEMCAAGADPKDVLPRFFDMVERASVVIAFSKNFDLRMVRMAAARHLGFKWECPKPTDDPMWIVAKEMKVKKPTLAAAAQMVLGEEHPEAHRALPDAQVTRRIYFEMLKRGYVAGEPAPKASKAKAETAPPQAKGSVIGDNGAPAFETIKAEIQDLFAEAKNFLDGEPIATEGQAAAVATLREKIREAAKRGEAMRKEEAKPFDEGKAEVQARYNPLVHEKTGLATMAVKSCNDVLAPWLRKLDEKRQADEKAAADRARELAADAQRTAIQARDTGNLDLRQTAEEMIAEATGAIKESKHLAATKTQVTGASRAVGLKTVWSSELTDATKALEHYRTQPHAIPKIKELLRELAAADVRAGSRDIPGFHIKSEQVPA